MIHVSEAKLRKMYVRDRLSMRTIALRLGCSHSWVRELLIFFDIPRRTPGKVPRKDLSGMSFGFWRATETYGNPDTQGRSRWLCLCTLCNQKHWVGSFELLRGKSLSCHRCCFTRKKRDR